MNESPRPPLLAALQIPVFRTIWTANIVSNVGTMMQSVAAAWLMTSLTTSTLLVGLVQTSSTLPVFLVGLIAGALADIMERKTLLFWSQAWMLAAAAALGTLTMLGYTTPAVLLSLTFAIGIGAAVSLPAWQASVQDIVPRESLAAAVALNSISFNVARAAGPALGGLVVAASGPGAAFLLNAASFLAVLTAVARWKPTPPATVKLSEDIVSAIRAGARYVIHAPRVQYPMIRAAAFLLCAGAVWPLLPLFAREILKTTATGYGTLLGIFGLGSILAALILPRLRGRYALDGILAVGALICAAALFGLSRTNNIVLAALFLFFCGVTWVGTLVNFNVAVQTSVPAWVRGRAISYYLFVFQGMLALDGALWGWLAGAVGIQSSFMIASGGLVAGLVLIRFFPLSVTEEPDLRPSVQWTESHATVDADPEDGPVLVTIEYFIKMEDASAFQIIMHKFREHRLRDGARRWRLYKDAGQAGRYLELFRLDSWGEHLRQHERFTNEDLEIEKKALAFHIGPDKPRVTHYLGVDE